MRTVGPVGLLTDTVPAVVSCGPHKDGYLHKAGSCGGCPQGHGEAWCGGDCQWRDGECTALPVMDAGRRRKRETDDNEKNFNMIDKTPLSAVDVFLNPARKMDMEEAEEYMLNMTR